ncbi:hypothetical protein Plhal304r1_c038g0114771 [Plasmopara halstedii]
MHQTHCTNYRVHISIRCYLVVKDAIDGVIDNFDIIFHSVFAKYLTKYFNSVRSS